MHAASACLALRSRGNGSSRPRRQASRRLRPLPRRGLLGFGSERSGASPPCVPRRRAERIPAAAASGTAEAAIGEAAGPPSPSRRATGQRSGRGVWAGRPAARCGTSSALPARGACGALARLLYRPAPGPIACVHEQCRLPNAGHAFDEDHAPRPACARASKLDSSRRSRSRSTSGTTKGTSMIAAMFAATQRLPWLGPGAGRGKIRGQGRAGSARRDRRPCRRDGAGCLGAQPAAATALSASDEHPVPVDPA
jgi:hypothetical protein